MTAAPRVAVTGASGFLGGHVVQRLQHEGWTVIPYGRRAPEKVSQTLRDLGYQSWDLASGPLSSPPEVDAVVHCAGTVTDWGPAHLFDSVNVEGTRAVAQTWPQARFVHVSTASVYDPRHGDDVLTEDAADPTDQHSAQQTRFLNDYGRTKRLAECVVAATCSNFVILRPHAIYGPNDGQLAPRLIERIRHGRIFIPGKARKVHISVTHVDNLIDGIMCAVASDAQGAYNVCDEVAPTIHDSITHALDAVGYSAKLVEIPRWVGWNLGWLLEKIALMRGSERAPLVTRFQVAHVAWTNVLDISRAKAELGYAPRQNFPSSFETISIGTP